eukprot:g83047.t1
MTSWRPLSWYGLFSCLCLLEPFTPVRGRPARSVDDSSRTLARRFNMGWSMAGLMRYVLVMWTLCSMN